MNNAYRKIDCYLNGWLSTVLLVIAEIVIVYLLSNTPFFLTALETKSSPDAPLTFFNEFVHVLQDEISKGALLSFISALIAPVVFWSFVEFKKAMQAKILSLLSLLVFVLSAYLHGKGKEFTHFSSIDLYWAAIAIWVLSILINRIPPDNNAYFEITDSQTADFVAKSKKLGHSNEH